MKEDEVVEESPWPPSLGASAHANENNHKKKNTSSMRKSEEEKPGELVANLGTKQNQAAENNKRPMRGPSLRLKTKRPAIYQGSDDDAEGFGSSDDSEIECPSPRGLNSTPAKNGKLKPRWKGEDMLRFPGYVSVCPASVREEEVTLEWMASGNFNKPYRLIGYSKERLLSYQKMNNVAYIRDQVGSHVEVRTIDVNTQNDGPKLSLYDWCEYWKYKTRKKTENQTAGLPDLTEEYAPRYAKRCLNVVSLSLANSPLEDELQAPGIVQDSDLVRLFWPEECTACPKPKAELYALMSPARCYTDWHIDFGGSSVWYNVVRGSKYFALAPPSEHNLKAFAAWANSSKQEKVNLLEYLKEPVLYELKAGDTMIIPGGWPHAVYTPSDSIAVGGNFLHPFNLNLQLEIWKLEDAIGVPMSCRFPAFKSLMWYVAKSISSTRSQQQQHLKLKVSNPVLSVGGGNGCGNGQLKIKLPSSPMVKKGLSSSTKTQRAVKLLLGQSACCNFDNRDRRASSSLRKLLLILNEWFEGSNFTSVPLDISSPKEMLVELETLLRDHHDHDLKMMECEEKEEGGLVLFTDYSNCKLREPHYKASLGKEFQKVNGNGLGSTFSKGRDYKSPQQQQQHLSPLAVRMKLNSSPLSNCLHTKKGLGSVKKVKKQSGVRDRLKKKLGMRR